jgi:Zn-dependent membrane protease YugP
MGFRRKVPGMFAILIILALLCFGVSRYAAGRYEGVLASGGREQPPTPHTGAEIAKLFLASEDIHDVEVVVHNSVASNYFDPKRRRLFLRKEVANQATMAAWAIALHEAAHATQVGDSLSEFMWRQNVIRLTRYGPMFGVIVAAVMFFLKFPPRFVLLGFVGFCVVLLMLNLGTLAIEFNANARLRRFLEDHLERWPSAQERLESYVSAVATREAGDLLNSPRYFFLSALPGNGAIRPAKKTDTETE